MTSDTARGIAQSLPSLSREDLCFIANAAKAAASIKHSGVVTPVMEPPPTEQSPDVEPDLLWLLNGLADHLRDAGHEFASARMMKPMLRQDRVPSLVGFFKTARLSRTQQYALLRLGCEMLQNNLVEIGLPPTARTMATQLHRIPALFNREFPGYAQMGMLPMIVRQRKS